MPWNRSTMTPQNSGSENPGRAGHNGGPPIEAPLTSTVWVWTDPDGTRRHSSTDPDLAPRTRPLPGRDRHGLMRPARDYGLERAFARQAKAARKPAG